VEDFFMANFEWYERNGCQRCVIDGESWLAIEVPETGGFWLRGPLWARSNDCDSMAAVEEEIQNQIDERRAALAESRGQEYQAWCRGWERV